MGEAGNYYKSMAEVKAANEAAGYHFFDADTMKFFNSRIHGTLLPGDYFITSESYTNSGVDRKFTIRRARADGGITTIGGSLGFRSYDTFEDAMTGLMVLRDGKRDKGVAS